MNPITPQAGLFIVYSGKEQPCPEAFRGIAMLVDRRTTDDPKKIPANAGTNGDWYERGTNHRIENGEICRDMGYEPVWFIKLETIAELLAFIETHGECVVRGAYNWLHPEIEIRDDQAD